jgi:hypothetical protein
LPGVRRLKVLPCPVPEAFDTRVGERWCNHCERHVNDSRELEAAEFDALIQRAASSRVCMRLELDGRRPKLRSAVAASVLVVALAGCASGDGAAPLTPPGVFMDSEPLAVGGSQITGFVIGEDGSALAQAVIMLEGGGLSTPVQATSNDLGMYGFSDVPPGDYTLTVFAEDGTTDASVSVPQSTRVSVSFRGPYPLGGSLIVGYVEIVDVVGSGSFDQAGPFLIDQNAHPPTLERGG